MHINIIEHSKYHFESCCRQISVLITIDFMMCYASIMLQILFRMFSDDEEFFDDLAGIDDSPESLPGSSDEEQFRELMRRRSSIEERMSRVDEMARQVSALKHICDV